MVLYLKNKILKKIILLAVVAIFFVVPAFSQEKLFATYKGQKKQITVMTQESEDFAGMYSQGKTRAQTLAGAWQNVRYLPAEIRLMPSTDGKKYFLINNAGEFRVGARYTGLERDILFEMPISAEELKKGLQVIASTDDALLSALVAANIPKGTPDCDKFMFYFNALNGHFLCKEMGNLKLTAEK